MQIEKPEKGSLWRHKKRGTLYEVMFCARWRNAEPAPPACYLAMGKLQADGGADNAAVLIFMSGSGEKTAHLIYRRAEEPLPDGTDIVIYRGEEGSVWARPLGDFSDGRFEKCMSQAAEKGNKRGVSEMK